MALTLKPVDCLARAVQERKLAANATLHNVRERHLRSALTWEELGSQDRFDLIAKPKGQGSDE